METATTKGLRNVNRGLILVLIYTILMIPLAILLVALVPELINITDPTAMGPLLGTLLAMLAVVCVGMVLALVAVILVLVGFLTIHKGKMEYGEEHNKNVDRATIFFVLVVVLFFLTIGSSLAMGIGATALTGVTFSVVTLGISLAGSIFTALFLYYLIKALIPSERENLAIMAVVLYIIAPVISIVGSLLIVIPSTFFDDPGSYAFDMTWILPSIASSILSLISMILFIAVYRIVIERLKSNQLPPVWAGPVPFMVQPPFMTQQPPEQRWQPPPKM